MTERLVPKPHMLKSIRARNWSLAGAIQELVDNSLGHGRASRVQVDIHNGVGILVFDDGTGIDDINRVFRLGDASAYDTLTQIGQYGVGAKHATIYLGDRVTVWTIRDGRYHRMTVDWAEVERKGEWPLAYTGSGSVPTENQLQQPFRTSVAVADLTRSYHLATSEKLASELGQVFAPALRSGVRISVTHALSADTGVRQWIEVTAFVPSDLTQMIAIGGETAGGLRWTGRAGLSVSLTDRHNGVHIAFGHRIIETTREPFGGQSAPTLYCEVTLDASTPWKHSLSEHKDKVVRNRDELMASIQEQLKLLLEQSSQQASYLALKIMAAPIEAQLTKALKAAGILHIDPEEEPMEGGEHGDTDRHVKRGKRLYTPVDEGDPGKPIPRPTGIQIAWRTREQLEDKLWNWDISGKLMTIELDKEQFQDTVGFPPKIRELHVVQLVASLLSHAIEMEYWNSSGSLVGVLTPKLRSQLAQWASESSRIAPYLNRTILEYVKVADAA